MSKEIKVQMVVDLPMLPNFIRAADGEAFGVETFSDEDLKRIGAAWTDKLIQHAQERRKRKNGKDGRK